MVNVAEAALFGESLPSALDYGTVSSAQAGKVSVLADVLTLSDGVELNRLLAVIADLAKSTHLDGTYAESPFTASWSSFVRSLVPILG